MKVCFDTSVLIAALLQQHPQHPIAFPHLQAVHNGSVQGFITTHAVAELFAVLTAMPLKPKLDPSDVQRMIRHTILNRFTLIPLGRQQYEDALAMVVAQNASSGAVYDALHLAGARPVQCARLYTFNLRHFRALAPEYSLI